MFLSQGLPSGFPVVIDVNLDQTGASNRLQYLVDGLYLDNATETLTVRLPTYNGKRSCYAEVLGIHPAVLRSIRKLEVSFWRSKPLPFAFEVASRLCGRSELAIPTGYLLIPDLLSVQLCFYAWSLAYRKRSR